MWGERGSAGRPPGRTGPDSVAAVELALSWRSEGARHTDVMAAERLSLAGSGPTPLEAGLLGRTAGHRETVRDAPGGWVPAWRDAGLLRLAPDRFDAAAAGGVPAPRAGRFYPVGALRGLPGAAGDHRRPFRAAEVSAEALVADLNHPLAPHERTVTATVLEVRAADGARGEALAQAVGRLVGDGPGMQARWRGRPTDFWSDAPFERADPRPDPEFYAPPRLVQHIDATAVAQVTALYARLVPRGARILDLMSSWVSHLPADLAPSGVTGLGMSRHELDANPQLTGRVVHDLNRDPALPFPAAAFDAAVCTVSVDYLVRPFEVFAEVARVLRPGGRFAVTFSNRWFPPKVVRIWEECHEFERMGIVLEYFHRAGRYRDLETWSVRGLPRPAGDEYAGRVPWADPVYAVWGTRA